MLLFDVDVSHGITSTIYSTVEYKIQPSMG